MPTIDVNGTTLYYEDTGPGSTGETIVFSHGLLWNTSLFAPQIAALRDRYRCIAWDHRGQGKSAADHRHTIGIELVWQDACALLDALQVKPVHFAGLSMGGFVAMRVGARRPDLVRSLILLETSMDPEPEERLPRYRLLTTIYRTLGPGVIRGQAGPIMFGSTILADKSRKAELAGYIKTITTRRDVWKAVNGVMYRAGIGMDEMRRIRTPTVVIVGDEDQPTPIDKAQRIVAAIEGARLVTIPHAGHSAPVEQADAVTRAIEGFLAAR
jgi:pimeloyl-ACP methyl ester carboxylesterase